MATRKPTAAKGRKANLPDASLTPEERLESRASELDSASQREEEALLAELEAESRSTGASGGEDAMARAAIPAIERVERRKDDPNALAERLTQRHLALGKRFLEDERAAPLDQRLRERVSRFIGRDPGGIRVHTGDRAAAAADALGARAFALGDSDIYFGQGQFNPNSAEGLGVLVHELTHVVDNSVGAAFDVGSSQAHYSSAEGRAHQNQESAEVAARQGDSGGAQQGQAPKIDMAKLEAAVIALIERDSKFMGERQGGH